MMVMEAELEHPLLKAPRLDSGTTIHGSVNVAGSDIVHEVPASQVLEDTSVADSTSITEWIWAYFTVIVLPEMQFVNKRSKKLES
ncbi:hypothetical protein V1525DRAFT_239185 [Lipomyces kononenkoae]|uniref:Uncharacterized protein n=1 Tax=Lipomyces kononenkoae TaxID=34357 RepID=A0ACC3SW87_LIPKO